VALITEAQCRERIPQLAGAPSGDPHLLRLIDTAGAACAAWCGWPAVSAGVAPTLERATYTLYVGPHHGGVIVEGAELWLPVRAVASVTSIHVDPMQGYSSTYLLASTDYSLDGTRGRIRLLPSGVTGAWSEDPYTTRVVVVAGFTAGEIPADVQLAAAEIVAHAYGQATQQAAAETPPLRDAVLPRRAAQLLARYRVHHHAAAGAMVPA